jgi:DNA-binding beta-propeller fold protein YncE
MIRLALAIFAALPFVMAPRAKAQDNTSRYDKVRKIEIGGEGGWDFIEVDAANRRLYVTRGTRVVVVDLDTEKVVGEIADTPGVHGVAFVPELNRRFTSNGTNSTSTVLALP